jgi:hypothetical protein
MSVRATRVCSATLADPIWAVSYVVDEALLRGRSSGFSSWLDRDPPANCPGVTGEKNESWCGVREEMETGVPVQLVSKPLTQWLRSDPAPRSPPGIRARIDRVSHLEIAESDNECAPGNHRRGAEPILVRSEPASQFHTRGNPQPYGDQGRQ